MNVVCTHCAHEFEMTDEEVMETGGSTRCPSCGAETSLGSIPSGNTLPWHPGQDGMPPGYGVAAGDGMFDAAEATAGEEAAAPPPARPKEQSVLLKLGDMQTMAVQASARQGDGPPEASGLLDIRMLAATLHHHEERAAHGVQFLGKADPSGPVALPTRAPALLPAPAKRKGGLIVAVVVFGVLIIAAVVLIFFVYGGRKGGQGGQGGQGDTSAAMSPMERRVVMDAMRPARRVVVMRPARRVVVNKPDIKPEVKKPSKPKKRPRKLRRKHIKAGLATVADKIADCNKDRQGRFKLQITVEGKTGKVKRVWISGRRKRKSKTGKCLKALFEKAQFTPFGRRRQTFTHRVRIK